MSIYNKSININYSMLIQIDLFEFVPSTRWLVLGTNLGNEPLQKILITVVHIYRHLSGMSFVHTRFTSS